MPASPLYLLGRSVEDVQDVRCLAIAKLEAERIDQYCYDNALALFLCAPQALYAVNNHVEFGPYRTTFEIAEVTVDSDHWSRQEGSSGWPGGTEGTAAPASRREEWLSRPGFSGANGNAC